MPIGDNISSSTERASIVPAFVTKYYPYINGASSLGELVVGTLGMNIGVMLDGLHGTLETVVNRGQAHDAHHHDCVSPQRQKAFRWILSSGFMAGTLASGGELTGLISLGDTNETFDTLSLVASGVSASSAVIASKGLMMGVRRKYGNLLEGFRFNKALEPTEKDLVNHIVAVDMPSSALAFTSSVFGLAASYATKNVDPVVMKGFENSFAFAMGILGLKLFNPFKAHDHDHSHEPHKHIENAYPTLPEITELS